VSDLTALKGLKREAVPLFTVEFITADNVTSQTSGFAAAGIGGNIAAAGAAMESPNLSKELDAGLIEVRLRVNFVQLSDDSNGFFGRLGSTTSTSGKVFPSVDNVLIGVQNGAYRSVLTMKNTLTLDPAAFAEVREKATTGADVASAVAVGLLRLAIGSKDSSSSTEMEAVADPQKYPAVVGAGLGSVNSMLVARIKAER
jgi:hypothetical protein